MKKSDVKALASMPLQSPTFPRGPYKFFKRQYLVIRYTTDPALIRAALPEPLEPVGDTVLFGHRAGHPLQLQGRAVQFHQPDVCRQYTAARRRPGNLGLSDEIRQGSAEGQRRYAHGHAALRDAMRCYRNDGL